MNEEDKRQEPGGSSAPPSELRGPQKILIVDDREENLLALEKTLSDLDVEILRAASGNEALAATIDHEFALAILDVQMPGMDGYELAELLRGDRKTQALPIIFLTAALADELQAAKGYEVGGIDYIVKPYSREIMLGKVKVLLELNLHRRHLEEMVKDRTIQITHLNSVLQSIRNVNRLIVREKNPARLIQEACQKLIEIRGFNFTFIALLDESKKLKMAAEAGLGEDFQPFLDKLGRGELTMCGEKALQQPGVVLTLDPGSNCGDCPLAGKYKGQVGLTMRLEHEGEVCGLIGLSIPRFLTDFEEELSLLEEVAGDIAFGLHAIERERERKRAVDELRIRNRISEIFLTIPDDEMYAEILKIIIEAMESEYGVFGYIDENGALVVPTLTRTVWDQCQVPDKTFVFPRETWGSGTWPRCLKEKRTIIVNEPSTLTPKGHLTVTRHISLPIIHQGESIGLLQVANRDGDYEKEDIRLLENLGNMIAPVLEARLQRDLREKERTRVEEELREHRDHLEELVEERTAELKKTNRSLEQENANRRRSEEALAAVNKELQAFSYSVSHDLRAPLRAIQGFSKILLEDYLGQLDSEGRRHLNTINSEVGRMRDLIDDILSLSRLSRQEMTYAPIDMAELVMTVAKEVEKSTPGRKLEVKLKKLPPARGDRNLIRQVLINLLSNAVKFSGTRETGRIEIGGKQKEEEITYYVKDNGVGFDMKYVDKLFGAFQRLHSSEEFEGTGVGLALVQRIIHRHGGRVWAESKANEGATFYFTLTKEEP